MKLPARESLTPDPDKLSDITQLAWTAADLLVNSYPETDVVTAEDTAYWVVINALSRADEVLGHRATAHTLRRQATIEVDDLRPGWSKRNRQFRRHAKGLLLRSIEDGEAAQNELNLIRA